jgi:hypothetical protein
MLKKKDPIVGMFAVTGSDGIFDYIDQQQVANEVANSLFVTDKDSESQSPHALMESIQGLIMKSSKLWIMYQRGYRDDITLAVKKIHL